MPAPTAPSRSDLRRLAARLGLEFVTLDPAHAREPDFAIVNPLAVGLLPAETARARRVLPIALRGGVVTVATPDPFADVAEGRQRALEGAQRREVGEWARVEEPHLRSGGGVRHPPALRRRPGDAGEALQPPEHAPVLVLQLARRAGEPLAVAAKIVDLARQLVQPGARGRRDGRRDRGRRRGRDLRQLALELAQLALERVERGGHVVAHGSGLRRKA